MALRLSQHFSLKQVCSLLWEAVLSTKQLPAAAVATQAGSLCTAAWQQSEAHQQHCCSYGSVGVRWLTTQAQHCCSYGSVGTRWLTTQAQSTTANSTSSHSSPPVVDTPTTDNSPCKQVSESGGVSSNDAGQALPSTHEESTSDSGKQAAPTVMDSISPHLMDAHSKAPLLSAQYASSADDKFGVQKNWFTSLYKQLNYLAKTGSVPALKDRQRAVFEEVERDFEALYNKHIRDKGHDEDSHRALLMVCLASSTYRVLHQHMEDTRLLRELIRTNLGSVMLALLRPLHRFKLRIFSWLLREDMYQEACKFLPALQRDMGALCDSTVQQGDHETMLTVNQCKYHEVLTQEETPFLLSEFCCHHALMWLHEFRSHGVVVSMDQCKAWDDKCCQLRIARTGRPSAEVQQPS